MLGKARRRCCSRVARSLQRHGRSARRGSEAMRRRRALHFWACATLKPHSRLHLPASFSDSPPSTSPNPPVRNTFHQNVREMSSQIITYVRATCLRALAGMLVRYERVVCEVTDFINWSPHSYLEQLRKTANRFKLI